jgi:hypothetical protein
VERWKGGTTWLAELHNRKGVGVLGCWCSGVLVFWGVGVLECFVGVLLNELHRFR